MTAPNSSLGPRALAALIGSMFLVGASFGAASPLVAALLEQRGFSEYFTGAVAATAALAIALCSPWAGRWISRWGPRRINLVGIVGQGFGFIAVGAALATHETMLFPARLLLGTMATLTFVAAEVALLRGVRPGVRGRVMAAYGCALSIGFAGGVYLANPAYEWLGLWCFAVVGVATFGIAPISAWAMRSMTAPVAQEHHETRARLSWTPLFVAMWGAAVYGAVETATSGTFPVEGQRLGFTAAETLDIVAMLVAGTILMQPLCGWLADHWGSVRVLCVVALFGLAASVAAGVLASAGATFWELAPAFLAIGCATGGAYPVCLKMLADRVADRDLPIANARFAAAYGYASLLGPLIAAAGIDGVERIGHLGWAIPGLCALAFLGLFPLLAWQRLRSR